MRTNQLLGVFLDRETVDRDDLEFSVLESALPHWRSYDTADPLPVLERLDGAAVALSNKVPLTSGLLSQLPKLKLICIAATGTNNVDLEAAKELGITICNVRGYATPSVVQHVFALLLSLTTNLPGYQGLVKTGGWQRNASFCLLDYPIRELAGKRLGIVGYGELGRAVAKVAESFGMEVRIAQRPGGEKRLGRMELNEMLKEVDVLSLHCPLTSETTGLIGSEELNLMKKDALLLNTARGGIVDEAALARALREGRIGGAGVDVLTREPPTQGNYLLDPDIPNLIVTPHIAWASRESRQRLLRGIGDNIRAYLQGTPQNVV